METSFSVDSLVSPPNVGMRSIQTLGLLPITQQIIGIAFLLMGLGEYILSKSNHPSLQAEQSKLKGRISQIEIQVASLMKKGEELKEKIQKDVSMQFDTVKNSRRLDALDLRIPNDRRIEAEDNHSRTPELYDIQRRVRKLYEEKGECERTIENLDSKIAEDAPKISESKRLMGVAALTIIPLIGTIFWACVLIRAKIYPKVNKTRGGATFANPQHLLKDAFPQDHANFHQMSNLDKTV